MNDLFKFSKNREIFFSNPAKLQAKKNPKTIGRKFNGPFNDDFNFFVKSLLNFEVKISIFFMRNFEI